MSPTDTTMHPTLAELNCGHASLFTPDTLDGTHAHTLTLTHTVSWRTRTTVYLKALLTKHSILQIQSASVRSTPHTAHAKSRDHECDEVSLKFISLATVTAPRVCCWYQQSTRRNAIGLAATNEAIRPIAPPNLVLDARAAREKSLHIHPCTRFQCLTRWRTPSLKSLARPFDSTTSLSCTTTPSHGVAKPDGQPFSVGQDGAARTERLQPQACSKSSSPKWCQRCPSAREPCEEWTVSSPFLPSVYC